VVAEQLQLILPDLVVEPESLIEDTRFDPVQVTFSGGAAEPFCRWYPYLEGYSPDFVNTILRRFAPQARAVLDPFGGTATTAFATAEKGLTSYICEVNPVMQFIFDAKTRVRLLDHGARMSLHKQLLGMKEKFRQRLQVSPPDPDLLTSYHDTFEGSYFFTEATLDQVLRARTVLDELNTEAALASQLLSVAVLGSLVACSRLKRAGDLRYKTEKELAKGLPPLLDTVMQKVSDILADVAGSAPQLKSRPVLICGNAKDLAAIPPMDLDTVITSPPYINGTNYFRNTKLELWFLRCITTKSDLRTYRSRAITAGINDVTVEKSASSHHPAVEAVVRRLEANAYDQRIPLMVASYFAEISQVFSGIRQHLKPGATVAIDIGDSVYGGVHIPADHLLTECLADLHYAPIEAVELRRRWSKDRSALKQVLLVFRYEAGVTPMRLPGPPPPWKQPWRQFEETLPHQVEPYARRNWGNDLHSLCSYQGKLKPAIAHHLVQIFVPPGGAMLDPFSGVGTIPFEAALQGRKAYGFDLSPTAHVIGSAKLRINKATETPAVIRELEGYVAAYVPSEAELGEARTFGFNGKIVDYYHPDTLREVLAAKRFFRNRADTTPSTLLVEAACLHILHGNRPYALSRRSHPITPYAPTGAFEYRALIPRVRVKVESALAAVPQEGFVEGAPYLQDATAWWPLDVDALDAVITSPPFFDSTRFYLANWFRLWFMGWSGPDFKSKPLSFVDERQKQSFSIYEPIVRQAKERLKPGGVLVLHLGKSHKCDMAMELARVGKRWFAHADVFDESVAHCESHGFRDKGTTTAHQYLVLY